LKNSQKPVVSTIDKGTEVGIIVNRLCDDKCRFWFIELFRVCKQVARHTRLWKEIIMKRMVGNISLIIEMVIPVGLLWSSWRLLELYTLFVSLFCFFLYLLLIPNHLKRLKVKHIAQKARVKLVFLTGLSIALCLSLILYTGASLIRIYSGGFYVTKEVIEVSKRGWVDIGCLSEQCCIYRLKSEIVFNTILLISLCLLYKTRCSANREQVIDVNDTGSKNQPEIGNNIKKNTND